MTWLQGTLSRAATAKNRCCCSTHWFFLQRRKIVFMPSYATLKTESNNNWGIWLLPRLLSNLSPSSCLGARGYCLEVKPLSIDVVVIKKIFLPQQLLCSCLKSFSAWGKLWRCWLERWSGLEIYMAFPFYCLFFLFFWAINTLFLYVYYDPVLEASFRHGRAYVQEAVLDE